MCNQTAPNDVWLSLDSIFKCIDNLSVMASIRTIIETSRVPIIFNNMLDDWELLKWSLEKWNTLFENQPLDCRKGKITCTKEPLWESKCSQETHSFYELMEISKNIENHGNWLYFDYKYIGEKVDEKIFQSISWEKFGYKTIGAKDSTLWIGSTGAHTPCHQDLYGINLVAQVHGQKRWILMPPEMDKYLKPSRIPYEESSCYSKINFSCPYYLQDVSEDCKCVEVILSPGDVLFVPHKWWHYVENLSTAISINTWLQIPKYDNIARLKESVVRFMVSSICSGVSKNIQLQLLNPNEEYSLSMSAESINYIDQSVKKIKNQDSLDSIEIDSTSSHMKYQYKTYYPEKLLCKLVFDTNYHKNNHSTNFSIPDVKTDISYQLLDALCNENVIDQIVNNLIKTDK